MSAITSAIKPYKCIVLVCTACGQQCDDDYVYHHDSVADAVQFARDIDWRITATELLCTGCHIVDDDEPDRALDETDIAADHPGFGHTSCVIIECGQCHAPHDDSDGTPHYSSPTEAAARLSKAGWVVTPYLVSCTRCLKARICTLRGHDFGDKPDRYPTTDNPASWCGRCRRYVPDDDRTAA